MGVITTKKSLAQLEKLSTSSFCRRRLAVVMVRLKMSENMKEAVTFIEQGHIRVGPDTGAQGPAWGCWRALRGGEAGAGLPAASRHACLPLECSSTRAAPPAHPQGSLLHLAVRNAMRPGPPIPQHTHAPTSTHTLAPRAPLHTPAPLHPPSLLCSDRPRIPSDARHGGLCDVGRHLQNQAQGPQVQRPPRRL